MEKLISPKGNGLVQGFFSCIQIVLAHQDWDVDVILGGRWMYYQWPCCWDNQAIMRHITFLELVPIVLSVMVWGEALSGKKVQFHTDNMDLVGILNELSVIKVTKDYVFVKTTGFICYEI